MHGTDYVFLFSFSLFSAFAAACLARCLKTRVTAVTGVPPQADVSILQHTTFPESRKEPGRHLTRQHHLVNSRFWLNPNFSAS